MYHDQDPLYTSPQEPDSIGQSPAYGGDVPGSCDTDTPDPAPLSEEPRAYTVPQAPIVPEPPKKKRKGMSAGAVIALTLCCSLLSGVAGGLLCALFLPQQVITIERERSGSDNTDGLTVVQDNDSQSGNTTTLLEGDRESTAIEISKIDTSKVLTAAEVYALNVNSTVGITTSITTNYWGYQTTSAASGSGFILTPDGYLLTNYHVVEGSSSITVSMYDGTSYEAAMIGYDESNDIAVLKIDAQDLTPVVLGDSDTLNVGDDVVAIGNPLGELTFSLTAGAVSAMNREVTMSSGSTMNLIQTDCAINSGNSGGALFNMYGEVIGITNAKYSSSGSSTSIDNIGFAIPVNEVRSIVDSIIEKGYVSKPYIGVSVTDVSTEVQRYGYPAGAAVYTVTDGSPAEEAGLQVNDIITEVNGEAVTGSNDLVNIVADCQIGDELELKVYRQGQTLDITVTVGESIQSATTGESDSGSGNSGSNSPRGR